MEFIQQILDFLNNVPSEVWTNLSEILFAAIIVSPGALAVKKWLKIDDPKRREKIMTVVVIAGSLLASMLLYLQSMPQFAPWFVLVQGWLIYATTQPVYYLFIKPLATRIGAWFTEKMVLMSAKSEAKEAAVPPEGMPVSSEQPLEDDFSH